MWFVWCLHQNHLGYLLETEIPGVTPDLLDQTLGDRAQAAAFQRCFLTSRSRSHQPVLSEGSLFDSPSAYSCPSETSDFSVSTYGIFFPVRFHLLLFIIAASLPSCVQFLKGESHASFTHVHASRRSVPSENSESVQWVNGSVLGSDVYYTC